MISHSQVPNSGFEYWDSSAGYKVPVDWVNNNTMTAPSSMFTCERGAPGYSGAYYLSLTARSITGMGTVAGLARSRFPFSSRPQILAGYWMYMAFGTDQGFMSVILTRWNSINNKNDTIANTFYALQDMVMQWETFGLPINYVSSATPDSATIILSTSGATLAPAYNNSFLWIDNLMLTDSVTLGLLSTPLPYTAHIYPNPAHSIVHISYSSPLPDQLTITLTDMNGKTTQMKSSYLPYSNDDLVLELQNLSPGIYTVNICSRQGNERRKLLIQ